MSKKNNNIHFELFRSPKRRGKTAPMVSTQDAEFDHRLPNYPNIEYQKRRTKTKRLPKYTRGGGPRTLDSRSTF